MFYIGENGRLKLYKANAFLDVDEEMYEWSENHEPEPEQELKF